MRLPLKHRVRREFPEELRVVGSERGGLQGGRTKKAGVDQGRFQVFFAN